MESRLRQPGFAAGSREKCSLRDKCCSLPPIRSRGTVESQLPQPGFRLRRAASTGPAAVGGQEGTALHRVGPARASSLPPLQAKSSTSSTAMPKSCSLTADDVLPRLEPRNQRRGQRPSPGQHRSASCKPIIRPLGAGHQSTDETQASVSQHRRSSSCQRDPVLCESRGGASRTPIAAIQQAATPSGRPPIAPTRSHLETSSPLGESKTNDDGGVGSAWGSQHTSLASSDVGVSCPGITSSELGIVPTPSRQLTGPLISRTPDLSACSPLNQLGARMCQHSSQEGDVERATGATTPAVVSSNVADKSSETDKYQPLCRHEQNSLGVESSETPAAAHVAVEARSELLQSPDVGKDDETRDGLPIVNWKPLDQETNSAQKDACVFEGAIRNHVVVTELCKELKTVAPEHGHENDEDDETFYEKNLPALQEMLRSGGCARLRPRGEGGVGLQNQGATCYMNSLLQALYYTLEFRMAMYRFRYSESKHGDSSRCIPFQLQRLFSELQLSCASAVSTKQLTIACGFSALDSMEQHDVQELCRVLFEALGLSSAALAAEVDRLYAGKVRQNIRSQTTHGERTYEGSREETFLDLQVPIQSCSTLEEAMQMMVKPEVLDGNNQWLCEELGEKIDAVKTIEFVKLPMILCLHLIRFVYDHTTGRRRKLADAMSIPLDIDLGNLFGSAAHVPHYKLVAVCLHRGTAHGGHYHAYVRQPGENRWRDANDSCVRLLTPEETSSLFKARTYSENASGDTSSPTGTCALSSSDAYFLIYRQESPEIPRVEDADIPEPIRTEIEADNERLKVLQRAYCLQSELIEFQILGYPSVQKALARYVVSQLGDLVSNQNVCTNEADCVTISVPKSCLMSRFIDKVTRKVAHEAQKGADDWSWARGLGEHDGPQARLRRYDPSRCELGAYLMNLDLASSVGDALGKASSGADRISLVLELCAPSAACEISEDGLIQTIVCVWDHDTGKIKLDPGDVISVTLREEDSVCNNETNFVDDAGLTAEERPASRPKVDLSRGLSPSVAAVRSVVAAKLGVHDPNTIALVPLVGQQAGQPLPLCSDEGSGTGVTARLADHGVKGGHVLCAELVRPGCDTLQSVELYERVKNTARIAFNHPDQPSGLDEHSVAISKNSSVMELKKLIAIEVGIDGCNLHLRRGRKLPQLKDETKTLRQVGIGDHSNVFVGHGAPCKPDEYMLQVSLFNKKNQKLTEAFEWAASEKTLVRSLREGLVEPFKAWAQEASNVDVSSDELLNWRRLRLRDGQTGKQLAVLRDDRTLRSALSGLSDGRCVAVQVLDAEEELGPDDVIIALRPWRVKEGRLHAATEVILSKSETIAGLRDSFAARFRGLLQTSDEGIVEDRCADPIQKDRLEMVVLPPTAPALTTAKCFTLKWDSSLLNAVNTDELSKPLSDIREIRDGATIVVRSMLAASARSKDEEAPRALEAAGDVAAVHDGIQGGRSSVGKDKMARTVGPSKTVGKQRTPHSVMAPARRERSLRIEVTCPEKSSPEDDLANSSA